MTDYSRNEVKKAMRQEEVLVNGVIVTQNQRGKNWIPIGMKWKERPNNWYESRQTAFDQWLVVLTN